MRIVEMAKQRNDPDHRHFSFFVYRQPSPLIQGTICFSELDYLIKSMHGKASYNWILFEFVDSFVRNDTVIPRSAVVLIPCMEVYYYRNL